MGLTRKLRRGEAIRVGDAIISIADSSRQSQVTLRIEAPKEVPISPVRKVLDHQQVDAD